MFFREVIKFPLTIQNDNKGISSLIFSAYQMKRIRFLQSFNQNLKHFQLKIIGIIKYLTTVSAMSDSVKEYT